MQLSGGLHATIIVILMGAPESLCYKPTEPLTESEMNIHKMVPYQGWQNI